MSKEILFTSDARAAILRGINKTSRAVVSTMGYAGRNVLISNNRSQSPITTKDGVTVAKSIFLSDPIENAAALLTRAVAEKTVEKAGDGTTCSILLFAEIVNMAFECIENGINSVEIKKGIELAAKVVIRELRQQAIPIEGNNTKINDIATVSANNDEEIGLLISGAFQKIGNDGDIIIEEGRSTKTEIRIDDGYQFDRGYTSPYWITNFEKMTCELNAPFILLVDGKIQRVGEIRGILEQMMTAKKRDILIIADSVEGEIFDTLRFNKLQKVLNVIVVAAPSYGDRRTQMMGDLAVLTGAILISQENGVPLEDASIECCGTCEKVIVTKDSTTIVNSDGLKEAIAARSKQISILIDQSDSDIERSMLKHRLGKFNSSIAVFSVGGITETEMKEKRDRVEDAIRATKCAIEEGIVAGGGVALLRCVQSLQNIKGANKNQKIGVDIISDALLSPIRQILINAGIVNRRKLLSLSGHYKPCDSIIKYLLAHSNRNMGYNVKCDELQDMVISGIIDPVKVIRVAFENAVSMACMVIISECIIVETD